MPASFRFRCRSRLVGMHSEWYRSARLGVTKRMMMLRMEKFSLDYQVFRKALVEVSRFWR